MKSTLMFIRIPHPEGKIIMAVAKVLVEPEDLTIENVTIYNGTTSQNDIPGEEFKRIADYGFDPIEAAFLISEKAEELRARV